MSADALIGYRKVIALLLGLLATWAVSKGIPAELANSAQGVLIELIPAGLSALYMWLNVKSKQTTAPTTTAQPSSATTTTTQTPTGQAQPPAAPSQTPATAAPPPPPPPPPTPVTPTMDTTPAWTAADDVLVVEQRAVIAEWYERIKTKPATMPVIPKQAATLYTDIKTRDDQRSLQAANDIALQATNLISGDELIACLRLRATCDSRIKRQIQYHFNEVGDRWQNYYLDLWLIAEGLPIY